jgi:hypothetical protein
MAAIHSFFLSLCMDEIGYIASQGSRSIPYMYIYMQIKCSTKRGLETVCGNMYWILDEGDVLCCVVLCVYVLYVSRSKCYTL